MAPLSRALALACIVGLGPDLAVAAEIYRWVDESGVSHYAEGLDSVPERHRATAAPLGFRNQPASAGPSTASEATARTTPRGGTVIRYAPGRPIIVDVRINGGTSVRLVFDTGADRTIISPRALRAAGVSLTKPIATAQVVGLTGSDRVPFVLVDSLDVGDASVAHLPVGAYEITNANTDGLLGRDFVDHFHVTLDSSRGLVTLSPK